MKKNYFVKALMKGLSLLFIFLMSVFSFAQNIGDYGATQDGFWSGTIWGTWNGTAFVGATSLPTNTTKNIYIPEGIKVNTGSANLTVYVGNVYVNGEFQIAAANFTFGSATTFIRVYGETNGTLRWVGPANGNYLTLSPNSYVDVSGFNGSTVNVPNGTNGLQATGCNNNSALYFGNVKYAVCGGGGNAIILFRDISSVGSLRANPKAETNVICEGATTYISGSASGIFTGSGYTTTISYQWFGPNANMSSNPPAISTNQSLGNVTLNTAGTYTYVLRVVETITNNKGSVTFTNDQPVTVTVNPKPKISDKAVSVCNSQNFTITPQNGPDGIVPTGTNYVWSAPVVTGGMTGGTSGSGSSIGGTLINSTNLPQSATYIVTPTSGAGCSGDSFTLTVTVNPANLTGNTNLTAGSTSQLTGSPSGGTYSSSNTSIATVNASGLVTAIAKGTTVITYKTPEGCSVTLTMNVGDVCYEDPASATTGNSAKDSKFGITSLRRAGTENDNWPMVRKGAYMVLESKTSGFVIPRMTQAQIDKMSEVPSNLVEGMAVYNLTSNCIYVYDGQTWNCYRTQTCPN